jgi:4-hydroxybenzoate polyprenyltransferase
VTSAAREGLLPTSEAGPSAGSQSAVAARAGWFHALRAAGDRALQRWGRTGAAIRAMRPLHWSKNLLVFVPLFEGHQTDLAHELGPALITVVGFCLCSSSAYVLNDLVDLDRDRCHPRKRCRPFAAQELSVGAGLLLALVLAALGLGVAAFAPRAVTWVLGAYWLGTLAYTLAFRQVVVLDVVCLAVFFTLRLLAGALAAGEEFIPWLYLVASLAFLSLAFLKRTIELRVHGGSDSRALHVYASPAVELLALAGKACGLLALVASALFVPSAYAAAIYSHPERLYLLLPLGGYWLTRIWRLAERGEVDEDPVVFVLTDRASHAVALVAAAITCLSIV